MEFEILKDLIKNLKLSVSEDYVFIADPFTIFTLSQTSLKYIKGVPIDQKYVGKMLSVDVINDQAYGIETDIGLLYSDDAINLYTCKERLENTFNIYNQMMYNLSSHRHTDLDNIQNTESFKEIMCLSAAEGAKRCCLLDPRHVMIISPCMLPMTKSSKVDISVYDLDNCFICDYKVKKPKYDIHTIMQFLYTE